MGSEIERASRFAEAQQAIWRQRQGGVSEVEAWGEVGLDEQASFAYELICMGQSEARVRVALRHKFGCSAKPQEAYEAAWAVMSAEQEKARLGMIPWLQAMRLRLYERAVMLGQTSTAAAILRDLGAVAGELSPSNLDEDSAVLTVEIMAKGEAIEEKRRTIEGRNKKAAA